MLEDYGGALRAYSWQDLSSSQPEKVADMAENWLSHLHSHKYLCILIRDVFDKKILSHTFFKVSLNSQHNIQLLKHNILAS